MTRRLRAGLPAAGLCVLLALVATYPLVLDPLGRLVGHPDVDAANHAWGVWWWWWTLGQGQLPWDTTLLAAPGGGVLWFIDPLLAAAGAPLVGLLGAVGAYNLAILGAVALAAAGGRALALALGAGPRAAWLGALGCAWSPYVLSEVHNGVSEAASVGWATFALAAARRAIDGGPGPGWGRRWAVTGAWLGVAAVGTWYYALTTGVTIGAWALLAQWRRPASGPRDAAASPLRGPVAGALSAGALGGLLAAPALALLRASIAGPRSMVVRGDVTGAVRELLLAHNAVDPIAFVAPGGFQSVDLAALGESFLHSSYLGLVAVALAAYGLRERRRDRPLLLGLLPAAVLSLGAHLWWRGAWVEAPWGGRITLPFAWVVHLLPDGGATHAQRLVWPVIATVAALAARGAEALVEARAPTRRAAALVGIGALLAVDLLAASPWPLARFEPLDLRAHQHLARLAAADRVAARASGAKAAARGVLDLPAEVGNTMATSRYLLYQSASALPIPYRPDARGGTAAILGVQAFNVLFYASAARPDQAEALRTELAGQAGVDIGSLQTRGGVRWVVLHREMERGRGDVALLQAQLERWFGAPEELGPHLTWDVAHRRDDGGAVVIPVPKERPAP